MNLEDRLIDGAGRLGYWIGYNLGIPLVIVWSLALVIGVAMLVRHGRRQRQQHHSSRS